MNLNLLNLIEPHSCIKFMFFSDLIENAQIDLINNFTWSVHQIRNPKFLHNLFITLIYFES